MFIRYMYILTRIYSAHLVCMTIGKCCKGNGDIGILEGTVSRDFRGLQMQMILMYKSWVPDVSLKV